MSSAYLKILVQDTNKLRVITFNNPRRRNAWDATVYKEIARALREANSSPAISTVAITGTGDIYSSGNDMKAALERSIGRDPDDVLKESSQMLRELVESFIHFEKLLIAVVNGPCVGIAATTVALCDVVYASKNAFFHTPFTTLALCAEGCSSVTFPRILGTSKASEMLLLSEKLTAEEALKFQFVSRLFESPQEMNRLVWPLIKQYSELPVNSLRATKKLVRRVDVQELVEANEREIESLCVRLQSDEMVEAAMRFLNKGKM